ncbi:MAG: hypothetical protein SGJ26_03365, partial [Nitrospirota bacterium]|nr:hypothetical protein [Nitrospirota bacterium]
PSALPSGVGCACFGVTLVREPDAGKPHVRFDERDVETGLAALLRHRQPKGPVTGEAPPTHRATSRLYRRTVMNNAG